MLGRVCLIVVQVFVKVGASSSKPISVAMVKGNALVFQACIGQVARKMGKAFQKRATRPHAELG